MKPEQIQNLKNQAISAILEAKTPGELERLRIAYLGRKGKISLLLKNLPKLEPAEKRKIGGILNNAKKAIEEAIKAKQAAPRETGPQDWLDVTIPGEKPKVGHLHLITQTIEEISRIFEKIGFTRVAYPEVEWDWYAFEGLNMPKNHPARDQWETLFIEGLKNKKYGTAALTPHTSSGQIREMERVGKPPIRMLNIAKCHRRQIDISHAPMFYQFEGLVIDKGISVTHLKGTLDYFAKQYFGLNRKTRIRPFHFRFTEPSFEVDVSCIICDGKARLPDGQGCRLCKEGWMELGGAGMVHPVVLKNGGIDPNKYSGFAWGWGIERLFMMRYGIPDIRLLFNGDMRFLKQF
jgi:phenylalanyl-tRNA synthetase alpha chain